MPGFDPDFPRWLLMSSASATVIAGVVLVAQLLFGRWLTPSGRQRLWWLLIARLLLPILPASALSISNLKFEMLWTSAHQEVHSELALDQSMVMPTVRDDSVEAAHHIVAASIIQPTRSWGVIAWIAAFAAWAIVVIAMISRLLWVNRAMSIRLRDAVVVHDQSMLAMVRTRTQEAGLRSAPAIVVTDAVATPAVHGIWRPRILMPTALLESLTPTQRRHVILHELSHIRHHDVLGNWLLAILSIVHWFNPLLWLAIARMKSDRELARDAWVIRAMARGDRAPDAMGYAQTLVDLAQRLNVRNVAVPLPALFGRTTSLRRRIEMIEQATESRFGDRFLGVAILILIACGLLTRAQAQSASARPASPSAPSLSVDKLKSSARTHLMLLQFDQAVADLEQIRRAAPDDEYAREILPFVRERVRTMPDEHVQHRLYVMLPNVIFDEVAFSDVLDFLRDIAGLKIEPDWNVLTAAKVRQNALVKVNLQDVPFDHALRVILSQVGGDVKLDYDVEGGVLKITTEAALRNDIVVRTYDIHDLLGPAAGETANDNFARNYRRGQLLTHIRDFVDRNTWKDNGGDIGTLHADGDQLIVTQRLATHRRLVEVLDALRAERSKKE